MQVFFAFFVIAHGLPARKRNTIEARRGNTPAAIADFGG